jgi:hypothetical protein
MKTNKMFTKKIRKTLQVVVKEWVGITLWSKGGKKCSSEYNFIVMTNFNKSFQRVMGNPLKGHSMRTFGKKIHESIQSAP